MNFTAIDVETANPDLASICQVGIVVFEDGQVVDEWDTLVDPEDDFDGRNVDVHGITSSAVKGAPKYPEIAQRVAGLLSGRIVAHHTAFDRVSIARASEKHCLPHCECRWLDTARVARRSWEKFAKKGWGLGNLAREMGIEFRHHHAREDARAAGLILMRAIVESGIPVEDWPERSRSTSSVVRTREGNPDGPLAGERIVFTGALTFDRKRAAEMAAEAGCDVASTVTLATTLLVVGDQDIRKISGGSKSSKHLKAEALISEGQPIRILGESDFLAMVAI